MEAVDCEDHNNNNEILIKKCRVCGDRASAFNFNGLSCESCKSFFRRNANRESILACTKQGNCVMTVKTRKFCAKCRLDRCFFIGMKKNFIHKRKQKNLTEEQEVDFIKCKLLSSLDGSPISTTETSGGHFPPLTNYEKSKIEEITRYYSMFKEEGDFTEFVELNDPYFFIGEAEINIRRLAKCFKQLPMIKDMNPDDQLLLFKNFAVCFTDIRSTFYFKTETESFLYSSVHNNKDICFQWQLVLWKHLLEPDFYNTCFEYFVRNQEIMLNDPIIRNLYITVALFRDQEEFNCRDVIRFYYLEYYYLLRRYLQTKLRSKEKFEKHMKQFNKILLEIPVANRHSRTFYIQVEGHNFKGILTELYNIE